MNKSTVAALRGTPGKHILRILDLQAGDREYEWEPGDSGAVAVAEREYKAAVAQGMSSYAVDSEGAVAGARRFDPNAEVQVLAPRMVGG